MSGDSLGIVPDGMGEVKYLVFEDGHEPYVADLELVLEEVAAFDQARIFLITPDCHLHEVHVESTDGDPDYLHWETTLIEGGELVERAEYDDHGKVQYVAQHVNGFVLGV